MRKQSIEEWSGKRALQSYLVANGLKSRPHVHTEEVALLGQGWQLFSTCMQARSLCPTRRIMRKQSIKNWSGRHTFKLIFLLRSMLG
jgi:hypothetical protein